MQREQKLEYNREGVEGNKKQKLGDGRIRAGRNTDS